MRSYKIIATTKNSRNLSKAPYSPNKRCLIIKPTINRYTIFFLGLILHPSGPGGCLFQDGPFYECSDSQTGPLPASRKPLRFSPERGRISGFLLEAPVEFAAGILEEPACGSLPGGRQGRPDGGELVSEAKCGSGLRKPAGGRQASPMARASGGEDSARISVGGGGHGRARPAGHLRAQFRRERGGKVREPRLGPAFSDHGDGEKH